MSRLSNRLWKVIIITGLMLSFITVPAYADTWGGTTSLNSSKYIELYYDSSVSSNGFTAMFGSALEEWTGISSQMKGIWHVSSHTTNSTTAFVTTTSQSGVLGMTLPYKKVLGIGVLTGNHSDWDYTEISIYYNQMNLESMTTPQKVKTIAHEMGHVQKLGHPSTTQVSIMNQGIATTTVQSYDRQEIKNKWGN